MYAAHVLSRGKNSDAKVFLLQACRSIFTFKIISFQLIYLDITIFNFMQEWKMFVLRHK